jgi:hypothetical protein
MAPTPGDKSLCFITGTRDGTRVASDRGGGGVVTNDSLAWQLDDAADQPSSYRAEEGYPRNRMNAEPAGQYS